MSAATNQDRWFTYETRTEHAFENEPALSCFVGKLFHHWWGRNAWWGVWSEHYPGENSFSLGFEETKQRIEKARTQGTQWNIVELPVLIIAGKDDALIVGEINTDKPLAGFRLPSKLDVTLESLGQIFQPRKEYSVCRLVTYSKDVAPAQMPFLRRRSRNDGNKYVLGWRPSTYEVDLDPLLKLVTDISKRLQKQ